MSDINQRANDAVGKFIAGESDPRKASVVLAAKSLQVMLQIFSTEECLGLTEALIQAMRRETGAENPEIYAAFAARDALTLRCGPEATRRAFESLANSITKVN